MNEAQRSCGECSLCTQIEYGYSSWTVLGYTWECKNNPYFPKADPDKNDVRYAAGCDNYIKGDPRLIQIED